MHVPPSGQQTVSIAALPVAEAYAEIAGDDDRPLLILRECRACAGTDLALLRNDEINDRTLLLTRWFHCVKLPADVLTANHPYRNLFTGNHPSHLFLCLKDGSQPLSLDGKQSQNDMWAGMGKVLRAAYAKDVDGPCKELLSLLDQFDRVDGEIERLNHEIDKEVEKNGTKSSRLATLQKKLKDATATRAELLGKEEKLRDLKAE
ncbi:MAG: hypothetical protein IPK26_08760 [Planctomycetes bacterium]|nr:hypothetical protein [Planctomycetota bacterium]